jgi:hypothetical protein
MLGELFVEGLDIFTERRSLLFLSCKLKSFICIGLRIQAAKAFIIFMFMKLVERSLFDQMMWLKVFILFITDLLVFV